MGRSKRKLIPAAALIRMSSDQQDDSPRQQRTEINRLARREGYRIVRWYEDDGISGYEIEKRPDLMRLLNDAQNGRDFDVVLVWKINRFGRWNLLRGGQQAEILRHAGVKLHSVTDGLIDLDDFGDRIKWALAGEMGEKDLRDKAEDSMRGRLARAKAGRISKRPCYGYDRQFYDESGDPVTRVPYGETFRKPRGWTSRFVVSENVEQVETVRRIFTLWVSSDIGCPGIARDLNGKGIPSPNGGEWWDTTIRNMVRNRVYAGDLEFGRFSRGKFARLGDDGEIEQLSGQPTRAVQRHAPVVIENAHEPIIDRETFERAQRKMAEVAAVQAEQRARGGAPRRYMLTGLLRCGHCGGRMHGNIVRDRNRGTENRYYSCYSHGQGGVVCEGKKSVHADALERAVVQAVQEHLVNLNDTIANKTKNRAASRRRGDSKALQSLRRTVAELARKINRGVTNLTLADPENVPAMEELLAKWRTQQAEAQARLDAADQEKRPPIDEAKLVNAAMMALGDTDAWLNHSDIGQVRRVLASVVESITIWWGGESKPGRNNWTRSVARILIRFRHDLGETRTTSRCCSSS